MDAAFTRATFERLGKCATERESTTVLSPLVDRLIHLANVLPACQRVAAFRDRWSTKRVSTGLFADRPAGDIDYVRGGQAHWYVYHWGGRWAPQFNIGMFGGSAGERRYLRIGLGFSLTLNSVDPNRDSRLQDLYSLFYTFQRLIRDPRERAALIRFMQSGGDWILERDDHVPDRSLTVPEQIVDWVARAERPAGWIFVGRRLSPDIESHLLKLESWPLLMSEIDECVAGLEPIWRATWNASGD